MPDTIDTPSAPPSLPDAFVSPLRLTFKRILAGNPFYLISAGLLLYGINQLTTDPKLVGAELPMLRFNFCALLLYEIMLVGTAIMLIRRHIWYDALLLFGLTNLFIIVPFSLISRAVFLSPHFAETMTLIGTALAAAKFAAFKRYAPELNLPRRLLAFGALLLAVNACAPLLFKNLANDPDQVNQWLNKIWLLLLPALGALAMFLPRQSDLGHAPGQKRSLPLVVFFAWICVTACHFGGLGYSTSFVWNLFLLVPVAWVATWALYLRLPDFATAPQSRLANLVLTLPLLLPLLATESKPILMTIAGLNLAAYGLLLLRQPGNFLALARLLGAIAIFAGSLPMIWITHVVPGATRPECVLLSVVICFFWLIFRTHDPRIAFLAAMGLPICCLIFAPGFTGNGLQVALVSLLAHSLRWDDQARCGAAALRVLAGIFWTWFSCFWLLASGAHGSWVVVLAAALLFITGLVHAVKHRSGKSLFILSCSALVLLSKAAAFLAQRLGNVSPGMITILASFALFAVGSAAAFSKPKWWSDSKR